MTAPARAGAGTASGAPRNGIAPDGSGPKGHGSPRAVTAAAEVAREATWRLPGEPGVPPSDAAGVDAPHAPALVTIDAQRRTSWPSARELWAHRELLYYLAWRDLKVRYKQTLLGVLWTVMLPLATALVFTVFIGRVARVQSNGLPYTLFAYSGLVAWNFFSAAVSGSAGSLVGSANLITKVYFPRTIVPAAQIAARLVDYAISYVVLALMMAWYHVAPSWNLLMLVPLTVLVAVCALAFGLWVAAVNVRYRDVGVIVPVALQLWLFASPVMYPMDLVPARWRTMYYLNPLAGIVDGFRAAVGGGHFNWIALGISAVVTLVLLAYALRTFVRSERGFADII